MPQNSSGAPFPDDESGNEDASQNGVRPPKSVSSFLMRRTRAMGSSGLQAATIGWVLAGCVFLGYLAGSWLDKHFGTQFWTPVLVLLGVVAGFREMFVTLGQVSKPPMQAPKTNRSQNTAGTLKIDTQNTVDEPVQQERKRERLFAVPAPPTASFDAKKSAIGEPISQVSADERELDTETVLRALMNEENEENQSQKDVKPQ